MDVPVTLLCKKPSENKEKRMEQALYCALIEGYTNATAELSRFITKLYQDGDANAPLLYHMLEPLRKMQDETFNRLVAELNDEPSGPDGTGTEAPPDVAEE